MSFRKSSPTRDNVCPWGFVYCQGVCEPERELYTIELDTLSANLGLEVNLWLEDSGS